MSLKYGDLDKVKYLISVGADVNAGRGNSIYEAVAARENEFEICKVLIQAGIIVYIHSRGGNTPLHIACDNNDLKIIELLLDNGADEKIKDNDGETPIEYVRNEEIKEFMNNYNSSKFILK